MLIIRFIFSAPFLLTSVMSFICVVWRRAANGAAVELRAAEARQRRRKRQLQPLVMRTQAERAAA